MAPSAPGPEAPPPFPLWLGHLLVKWPVFPQLWHKVFLFPCISRLRESIYSRHLCSQQNRVHSFHRRCSYRRRGHLVALEHEADTPCMTRFLAQLTALNIRRLLESRQTPLRPSSRVLCVQCFVLCRDHSVDIRSRHVAVAVQGYRCVPYSSPFLLRM